MEEEKKEEEKCRLFPRPNSQTNICAAGSEISSDHVCSVSYSKVCEYANRLRTRPEYLGDGIYAIYDGDGVWLHANDHEYPTDSVYLEPVVLKALTEFYERKKVF